MKTTAPALAEVTCPYGHSNVEELYEGYWYCEICEDGYNANEMLGLAPATGHTHSWSYQANGATVTASCGQGCDITEGLSITISAPLIAPILVPVTIS